MPANLCSAIRYHHLIQNAPKEHGGLTRIIAYSDFISHYLGTKTSIIHVVDRAQIEQVSRKLRITKKMYEALELSIQEDFQHSQSLD